MEICRGNPTLATGLGWVHVTPAKEGERGIQAFQAKKIVNAKKTNPMIRNLIFGNFS